jgi:hypothetical protein
MSHHSFPCIPHDSRSVNKRKMRPAFRAPETFYLIYQDLGVLTVVYDSLMFLSKPFNRGYDVAAR